MWSDGKLASRTAPAGALRGGLERRAGGSLPTCAQSGGITHRAARASAVGHYGRFGSPWLGATTSCFRAMPRLGFPYTRG